jgi:hypothetical protein
LLLALLIVSRPALPPLPCCAPFKGDLNQSCEDPTDSVNYGDQQCFSQGGQVFQIVCSEGPQGADNVLITESYGPQISPFGCLEYCMSQPSASSATGFVVHDGECDCIVGPNNFGPYHYSILQVDYSICPSPSGTSSSTSSSTTTTPTATSTPTACCPHGAFQDELHNACSDSRPSYGDGFCYGQYQINCL